MRLSSIPLNEEPAMNAYSSLLFLHGHIADPALAASLSSPTAPAREPGPVPPARSHAMTTTRKSSTHFFKSLLYLGGLESIDSRIGEEEEAFGPTYGNRLASARAFGQRARDAAFHRPVLPVAQRLAGEARCVAGGCG
jgi:hypothetical protein